MSLGAEKGAMVRNWRPGTSKSWTEGDRLLVHLPNQTVTNTFAVTDMIEQKTKTTRGK